MNNDEHKKVNHTKGATLVRLQKYLAEAGVASRRKSEDLIQEGKVKVNGKVANILGTKVDPTKDSVTVGRRHIHPEHKGIILFHKPTGVISTKMDPQDRKTIMEFFGSKYQSYNSVGRLDFNSSGLLIMTNDGELANILMHPKYGYERQYEVLVKYNLTQNKIDKIKNGVRLEDGTIQAEVLEVHDRDSKTQVILSVKEGRNRVIRRMMKKLGHPVIKLKRISYGPFKLGNLKSGQYITLTEAQYRYYKDKLN